TLPGTPAPATASAPPPAAPAPAPIAGAETLVTTEDGRQLPARLLRSYFAASGRECREVLLGSGLEERSSVICAQDGAWVVSPPLLGGRS
ncbi:MAG TPA: hypothetical protein VE684_13480, partial [Crenalkalicoccus sp.]|nr:hypothetical protein [Crenalkalicoccus sp.]